MPRIPSNLSSQAASVDRRHFLQKATLTGAATLSAPALLRGRNLNEKLNIAIIGAGGRGRSNTAGVAGENIVALCDVNQQNLDQAAESYPQARQINDFRKLFDHANEFDAVVVSTCEHTHAFATLRALELGKHVYCEKPLTHNIWEARIIRKAAAKAKVATQMGIQIHAGDNYRRVVELIQSGAIGKVNDVHVWVSRAWGWQPSQQEAERHKDIVFVQNRPAESHTPPAGLDWDLWLGPAPARPFNNVYFPGPKWYRLVGLWQWHHVRSGQSLARPAVLGARPASPHSPSKCMALCPALKSLQLRCELNTNTASATIFPP